MRDYLSASNFGKAFLLGSAMTLMSLLRIKQGGLDFKLYSLMALFSLTLVSGAAVAWQYRGGMCGLFPSLRRTAAGILIAMVVVVVTLPVLAYRVDPVLMDAINASDTRHRLHLHFPTTLEARVALLLWTASFETIFFQGGTLSLVCRVSNNQIVAIGCTVFVRLLVSLAYLSQLNLGVFLWGLACGMAAITAINSMLYTRFGLIPSMVYAAGMTIHVFMQPIQQTTTS